MSTAQRLIDHHASKVLMHEACSRLEAFVLGDQAVALWALLYRTADRLDEKLQIDDPPVMALRLFLEEAISAYEEITGEPWRPAEPEPANAEVLTMPANA